MCDSKELEVIETALVVFKSSSNHFDLSPDVDEGLKVPRSRDTGIFKVCKNEIEFRTHEEIHTLLDMPRV